MVIKFQRGRGYTNSQEYVYSWHLISFHLIFIVKQHIHSVSGLASCFKPHQADIDINKRVVYICIYVYMSFCLPGYLRHFNIDWKVWSIFGTDSAGAFWIWIKTKPKPNWPMLVIRWHLWYQKHLLKLGNSMVVSDKSFKPNQKKTPNPTIPQIS